MSDNEEHAETFESTDSGASLTYPMQAGLIRKGAHIVIKGRPCKVRARPAPDRSELIGVQYAVAALPPGRRGGGRRYFFS
jgi:hypothetical protein